ncbi:nucleoside 2-deoxyribosyltransferase [Aquabacter sp. L1I39]|uniref:nucleoside 2-deoxyribosyltransferase n=1 Tax=Aquabacter sp. L1I39 TaxID=2820278 RepID=UPI001ADBFDC5|nr:nucleoside 2-deoxyribosyltransferase [Aquabacter sp. L1I39]QTL03837.1 nucleoside 2-deoxyribosyltransferase [Aquabacter sp. L1I39]
MPVIYLAGPEVFRPDALSEGERLKALCTAAGLSGLYPLDGAPPEGETAVAIRSRCIAGIERADALVANISPFRGAHMDPGTAWEIGYAQARGKRVHLWSADTRAMRERVAAICGSDGWRDENGHLVEDFGQTENLMICGPDAVVHDSPEAAIAAAAEGLVHPAPVRAITRLDLAFKVGVAMLIAAAASFIVPRLIGW